jgi:hypothetical protein
VKTKTLMMKLKFKSQVIIKIKFQKEATSMLNRNAEIKIVTLIMVKRYLNMKRRMMSNKEKR